MGKEVPKLVGTKPVAAVVIMACNRPDYLDRTLNSVLKYQRLVAEKFPLFVSQACVLTPLSTLKIVKLFKNW